MRRISGDEKFGQSEVSDIQVRKALGTPSLDCLIQRKRLLYLQRVACSPHNSLLALLGWRTHDGTMLPWVRLVTSDLACLFERVQPVRDALPHPADACAWYDFMRNRPKAWSSLVNLLFYSESVCDKTVGHAAIINLAWTCEVCANKPCFSSSKALKQHERIAHKLVSPVKAYIGDITVCPKCGTNFKSRLRLISHLLDRRRGTCQSFVIESLPKVPEATYRSLELRDNALLSAARKSGHSHALAVDVAITSRGKRVGRVQN